MNEHSHKVLKKERNLPIETDALSLHTTDSSENEEIMSVASNTSHIDTFF